MNYSQDQEEDIDLIQQKKYYDSQIETDYINETSKFRREVYKRRILSEKAKKESERYSNQTNNATDRYITELKGRQHYQEKMYYLNQVEMKQAWYNPSCKWYLLPFYAQYHCQVTSLSRKYRRKFTFFLGNGEGMIGWGTGSGQNLRVAWEQALLNAQQNIITIPLDHFQTFYGAHSGWHNGCEWRMWRNDYDKFWGYPMWSDMLVMSGIHHMKYAVLGQKKNKMTILYAYLDAVTKNKTLKDVCEEAGKKPYQIFHGNPRYKIDKIDRYLYKPKYLDKMTDLDQRMQMSAGLFNNQMEQNKW